MNTIQLQGALTYQTVSDIALHHASDLQGNVPLLIDVGEVTQCDSAGLALLIDWLRQARQQQLAVRFSHLPKQLHALAEASGVTGLLAS